MRPIRACMIPLLAAALLAAAAPGAAAQTTADPPGGLVARPGAVRPALAAPIEVTGASLVTVPAEVLSRLTGQPAREPREVLDIRIAVRAEALAAMPDSLEPVLMIGRSVHPVQRVEYENWDLAAERPVDPDRPVGSVRTLHVLVLGWQELPRGAPMLLTVLSLRRLLEITDGQVAVPALARALPETGGQIPRFDPAAFLEMNR